MVLTLRKQHEWESLRSWAGRVNRNEIRIPQGTHLSHRQLCALGLDPGTGTEANTALAEYQSFRALELEASQAQDPVQRLAKKLEAQWQKSGMFQRLEASQTNHAQVNARLDSRHSIAAKLALQALPQLQEGKDDIGSRFARRVSEMFDDTSVPVRKRQAATMEEIRLLMQELLVLMSAWAEGHQERVPPQVRKKLAAVRQIQAVA